MTREGALFEELELANVKGKKRSNLVESKDESRGMLDDIDEGKTMPRHEFGSLRSSGGTEQRQPGKRLALERLLAPKAGSNQIQEK